MEWTKQLIVGKDTVTILTTDEPELVEISTITKVLQTLYVETFNRHIQRLSREICGGFNWEGYLMQKNHNCRVVDKEVAWHKHWELAHKRINPALFFAMAQDICRGELNLCVTFHWKLLVKELFNMNALESYLLYLQMRDWTEYETIAEFVCE